jgi:hypothetical protein
MKLAGTGTLTFERSHAVREEVERWGAATTAVAPRRRVDTKESENIFEGERGRRSRLSQGGEEDKAGTAGGKLLARRRCFIRQVSSRLGVAITLRNHARAQRISSSSSVVIAPRS